MSYVEVFVVHADGDVSTWDTAHNNHCYAPYVWEALATKYKFGPSPDWPLKDTDYVSMQDHKAIDALWKAWGTARLSRRDNVILGSTFDRVWIRKDGLPELLAAQHSFMQDHPTFPSRDWKTGKIEQIVPQGTILACGQLINKALIEVPDMLGIAFNMCSANSAFWRIPATIENDTELDDERNYNVLTDAVKPRGQYKGQRGWEMLAELEEVARTGTSPEQG